MINPMRINFIKMSALLAGMIAATMTVKAQLTIDECQRLARENYPLISRYDLVRQTVDLSLSNIGKEWLPQLAFSGQATYQSGVMSLPEMLQNLLESNGYGYQGLKKDQYKVALDLNQTIYDGGGINARKGVVRAESKASRRQVDVDLYALRERIDDIYFGLLLLDDKIRLNEDLQRLLSANCGKLEAMLVGGVAMQADVDAVKAELLNVRQQNIELHSSRRGLCKVLSIFIGEEVPDSLVRPEAALPDNGEIRCPELYLFDARMEEIAARDKLLDASIRPRVSLFAQGWYGYPGLDMFSDMFSRDWTLNGMVGVRLSWNIGALYTRKNDKRKLVAAAGEVETARKVFLFNNRLRHVQETIAADKYADLLRDDEEIISLRTSVRMAAEAKLEHGTIDVNDLLREITYENQARIGQSVHYIEMLKTIYEIKNTLNQ